ncbi:NADH-quinone oxidoreductase subunit A [Buchnera aphidicola]|uniref:NADH-quinone oxidoreductase subunit n=1 Tax=Buchnera aphidicola subsp. Tuberolachnus salignus TaxID=98804 RepID=A0A160SWT1_BUCTT|nr:NADH-quinone oxidoreductase subunit A [Buchnera aphidicola]CUR53088.1 NADH-quinone oxidoreductase subunit A [Buchnera aphidicola (Tuberolachnus salignus)]
MQNYCFFYFIIISIILCCSILLISFILGGKSYSHYKNFPFECGMPSLYNSRFQMSIQYYVIAILFVIFDTDILYLYTWSISIHECEWFGFLEAIFFILFLLITLLFLVKMKIIK